MATHVAETCRRCQSRYNKVVHGQVIFLSLRPFYMPSEDATPYNYECLLLTIQEVH